MAKAPAPATRSAVPAEKTPAKKAASSRSSFPAAWLRSQEAELPAEADALVADFESGDSQFDEDGGEGDTLSSERERDLALSAQARAAIEEIDHALTKFALGTSGMYPTGGIGRP